jgi:hypothetical protein
VTAQAFIDGVLAQLAVHDDAAAIPRVDVEDWLAMFVLHLPANERGRDPALLTLMGSFVVRAGLETLFATGAPDGAALEQALSAYVAKHPPAPALVEALQRASQTAAAQAAPALQQRSRAFFGDAPTAGVLGGGQRPAGSVAAGPMARFQMVVPKKP